MYIPKNKIKESQYTAGKQYVLAESGDDYVGFYYSTYDGKFYSGKTPNSGFSKLLIPFEEYLKNKKSNTVELYDTIVKNNDITKIKTYESIPMYYPKPTPQDYQNGFMVRYFAKRKNGGVITIQEISQEIYYDILNLRGKYDFNLYGVMRLHWKITGPLYDNNTDKNFPKPGVVNVNQKTLLLKENEMSGISQFLNNLQEFAQND